MTDSASASPVLAALDTSRFTPNPEVVAELTKAASLPREAKAFLLACSIETLLPNPGGGPLEWPYRWSQFNCLFGFKAWSGSLSAFPSWDGEKIGSTMTHAAGAWQDEPDTYAEIAAMTGHVEFTPQAQIANNWVLAVRDFKARTGKDLLEKLKNGAYAEISPGLIQTWPGGCDAKFPARFVAALESFPNVPPAPPAPPPAPVDDIEIPVGLLYTCGASMSVKGVSMPLSSGVLSSSNGSVCSITVADDGNSVILTGLSVGRCTIESRGTKYAVSVVDPEPDHVTLDLKHGKWSRATHTTAWLARVAGAAAVITACLVAPAPRWSSVEVARPVAGHTTIPALKDSTFYFDRAGRVVLR